MKSKSQELLDKSIAAMVSAIEIYNKPDFLYRGETFAILAINSWELLFKAKYLRMNNNKIRSLYVFENRKNKDGTKSKKKVLKITRSGNPYTHNMSFIAQKLIESKELNEIAWRNIEALVEIRDSSVHFYNYSSKFNVRIQEIGTASLKNYVVLMKKWFERDLSNFNFYLMPLSFVLVEKTSDILVLNSEERNFLQFINDIEKTTGEGSSEYSIALNMDIKFSKVQSENALPVILSKDPTAIKVVLTESQIKEKYPLDYKQLTSRCAKRFEDFKVNQDYHDYRRLYENDDKCAYIRYLDPENPDSSKKIFYSDTMLLRLDKHYTKKQNNK